MENCNKCGATPANDFTGKGNYLCEGCLDGWSEHLKLNPLPTHAGWKVWTERYEAYTGKSSAGLKTYNEKKIEEKKGGEDMKTSRHYTDKQKEWLLEKAKMDKFRTKGGRLKMRKIRDSFEVVFGEIRSKQALGYQIMKMTGTVGREAKREAKQKYGSKSLSETVRTLADALKAASIAITRLEELVG